jgi:salicylate hydroxylase
MVALTLLPDWKESSTVDIAIQHHSHQAISPSPLRFTLEDSGSMDTTSSTIRVAIVGGGLAGALLIRGLLRYPHIAVDLYEPRPSPREEGPGIDVSDTSQDVLQAIDPALDSCLGRAGTVYSTSELRIATGPHAGQTIDTKGSATQARRSVGWQAYLAEVLAGVPPHMIHTNASLSSIVEASVGGGLILTFSNGVQKKYDVVIGADGIRGKARAHVAGPDDPARNPKPTGFWGLPIQVPLQRAQQFMGAGLLDPNNRARVFWIGDGTLLQHNYLNGGRDVQIMAAAKLDNTDQDFTWAKLFTPDEFEDMFSQHTSQDCQGMIKVWKPGPDRTHTLFMVLTEAAYTECLHCSDRWNLPDEARAYPHLRNQERLPHRRRSSRTPAVPSRRV